MDKSENLNTIKEFTLTTSIINNTIYFITTYSNFRISKDSYISHIAIANVSSV